MNVTTRSLGDTLVRTYGHYTDLPTSALEASKQGWVAQANCNPNKGILYGRDENSPSEEHPLGLYFTASGKLAGVQVTVYGSNEEVGNAAPDRLVEKGFWIADPADKQWHMDLSFRAASEMCGERSSSELLGDRLVINQGTLDYSLPLVASEARQDSWTEGSCMHVMGQHHFYDFNSAPEMSWDSSALLPVVTMYDPPFDENGVLNAFFFTTPVAQPGSSAWNILTGKEDWESPALTPALMCQNWCDDSCTWDSSWATMHLFVKQDYKDLKCPGASKLDPIGISCSGVSKK